MALLFTHPCPLGPEQHCLGGPGARGATHGCQWSQEELHEGEMLTEAAGQPPELVVGAGRCPSGPGPCRPLRGHGRKSPDLLVEWPLPPLPAGAGAPHVRGWPSTLPQ